MPLSPTHGRRFMAKRRAFCAKTDCDLCQNGLRFVPKRLPFCHKTQRLLDCTRAFFLLFLWANISFVSETTIYIGGFRNKQKNLFAGSRPNRSCQLRQRSAGLLPLVRRALTGSSSASYRQFVGLLPLARGLTGGEGELRRG